MIEGGEFGAATAGSANELTVLIEIKINMTRAKDEIADPLNRVDLNSNN